MTASISADQVSRRRFSGSASYGNASQRFAGCVGKMSPTFNMALQTSISAGYLVGTPTFTRATTAYQTDFEGKQNLVLSGEARFQGARRVRNLIGTTSEDFSNAAWVKDGTPPTITAGQSDPNGGTAAYKMVTALTLNGIYNDNGGVGVNDTRTISIWLRGESGGEQVALGKNTDPTTVTLTTSWQRYSATQLLSTQFFVIRPIGTPTIYLYRAMDEVVTGQTNQNPSEYVSVGVLSAPYHGAGVDGVKYFNTLNGNTVASNVVTEATGAAIVAGAAGVSATAPVDAGGPQGILGSQAVTQYLGVTEAPATQTTGSLGTGTYTLSVLAGMGSATSSAGTATITGGGAATLGSPNTFTVTVAGTVTVTVAGTVTRFSLNSGSFIKPYMANSGAAGTTATANADTDQYVSSGNIPASNNNFTLYGETTFPVVPSAASYYLWSSYVDANNSTSVLWDGTNLIARRRISGTSHDATIALTPVAGTTFKWAAVFSSTTGTQIYLNGTAGTSDATTTACQISANFQINADGNSANQPYATSRIDKIYPTTLSAAKLTSMTT